MGNTDRQIQRMGFGLMIAEYDNTGRIFHIVNDPAPVGLVDVMKENGCNFIETDIPVSHDTHYVVGNVLTERPADTSVASVTGVTVCLTDVLPDSRITITLDGETFDAGDETEFEFDEPGSVTIRVVPPWPHKETEYVLEVE